MCYFLLKFGGAFINQLKIVESCLLRFFLSEKRPLDILYRSLYIVTPQAFLQKHLVVINGQPRVYQKFQTAVNRRVITSVLAHICIQNRK